MKILEGKNVLIVGVANKHSIAAGIAESMSENGANVALTYQNDRLKGNVEKLGQEWGVKTYLPCDVSSDDEIKQTFSDLSSVWDGLDAVIHAVGFAPREELDGEFVDVTSREGFQIAHDISSYSFIGLAKEAKQLMEGRNGSLLTLSYLGSQMTLPNYNVMGVCKSALEASVKYLARDLGQKKIRVNAISAGPIKTLAASAIGDAKFLYKWNEDHSFLKRNVDIHDVGNSALYLLSNLANGVTGEIHYVDAGYNKVGMPDPKNMT